MVQNLSKAAVALALLLFPHWAQAQWQGMGLVLPGNEWRCLHDYPSQQQRELLDLLFSQGTGLGASAIFVEVGSDAPGQHGTLGSHMHHPSLRNTRMQGLDWLVAQGLERNPDLKVYGLLQGWPSFLGAQPQPALLAKYLMYWCKQVRQQGTLVAGVVASPALVQVLRRDWDSTMAAHYETAELITQAPSGHYLRPNGDTLGQPQHWQQAAAQLPGSLRNGRYTLLSHVVQAWHPLAGPGRPALPYALVAQQPHSGHYTLAPALGQLALLAGAWPGGGYLATEGDTLARLLKNTQLGLMLRSTGPRTFSIAVSQEFKDDFYLLNEDGDGRLLQPIGRVQGGRLVVRVPGPGLWAVTNLSLPFRPALASPPRLPVPLPFRNSFNGYKPLQHLCEGWYELGGAMQVCRNPLLEPGNSVEALLPAPGLLAQGATASPAPLPTAWGNAWLAGDTLWQGYRATARVYFGRLDGWAWLAVALQPGSPWPQGLRLALNKQGQVRLQRLLPDGSLETLSQKRIAPRTNRWQDLRLELQGDQLVAWVNDVKVATHSGGSPLSGAVAFGSDLLQCCFDDVHVEALPTPAE